MKTHSLPVALAIAVLVTSAASAQPNRVVRPTGTLVAVVDLKRVFEQCPPHQQALEAIKNQIQTFEREIQNERKAIAEMNQQVREFKQGSDRYRRIEEQAAKRTVALKLRISMKRRDVQDREAKVFYATYTDAMQHIKSFCQRSGVQMVMSYDSTNIDPADRRSVLNGMNRSMLYQTGLDITDHIITQMRRQQ